VCASGKAGINQWVGAPPAYPTPSRLARDVLTQAGVRAGILLQGNVDIGAFSATAEGLAALDQQIILQAHMAGLKIYGGTLTPFGGSNPGYGVRMPASKTPSCCRRARFPRATRHGDKTTGKQKPEEA